MSKTYTQRMTSDEFGSYQEGEDEIAFTCDTSDEFIAKLRSWMAEE